MKYFLKQNLFKETKEEVIRTELGDVILRIEMMSMSFGTKILVYDRYHVPIGEIKKGGFRSGARYEIIYDDRIIATILKKRRFLKRRLVLKTIEDDIFGIKGDIKNLEYVFQRNLKVYARITKKGMTKPDLVSMQTKDKRLRYIFLCGVVALGL